MPRFEPIDRMQSAAIQLQSDGKVRRQIPSTQPTLAGVPSLLPHTCSIRSPPRSDQATLVWLSTLPFAKGMNDFHPLKSHDANM